MPMKTDMIIYTVAKKTHECHGFGDPGNDLRICKEDRKWVEDGPFPPCFLTRTEAETYLNSLSDLEHDMTVVELRLMDVDINKNLIKMQMYKDALQEIAAGPCCGWCTPGDPYCDVGIAKDAIRSGFLQDSV